MAEKLDATKRINRAQKRLDNLKAERAEAAGRQKEMLRRLREDYNAEDEDEARKLLKKAEEEEAAMRQELSDLLEEMDELQSDIQDTTDKGIQNDSR